MNLSEILRQTFAAFQAHKMRIFLTMFGIAWGVGSLLLLVGLGEGFRAGTEKSLASFGEDYMQIYAGCPPLAAASFRPASTTSTIRIIWTSATPPLFAMPRRSSTAATFDW